MVNSLRDLAELKIELPDELYLRAQSYASAHALSLAEVVVEGVKRVVETKSEEKPWELTVIRGNEILVPLERLKVYTGEVPDVSSVIGR